MQPQPPNTATDAINTLYSTLRSLAGPAGLSIVPPPPANGAAPPPAAAPPDPAATARRASNVHALSRVSLPDARRTLFRALETLKAAAAARESWPPDTADRLLRVKADTHTRLRATRATAAALGLCRRMALTADPFATRCVQAAHRLQSIADDVGAATFRDDADASTSGGAAPSCEISVSGARFLIDFSFPDLTAAHVAVDVNFRFLISDTNVERPDAAVGHSFASLMRRERFVDLRAALLALVKLEQLDDAVPGAPLCDALRALEDDLLAAAELEAKLAPAPHAAPHTRPHGAVERTARGLRLSFMPRNAAHLVVEPARGARDLSVGRAGAHSRTDASIAPPQQQPHAPPPPPVPPVAFGDAPVAAVAAQYVLVLHRPVVVALRVAQQLDRVAAFDDAAPRAHRSAVLSARALGARDGRDGRGDGGERKGPWPSLQRLLAGAVFGASGNGGPSGAGSGGASGGAGAGSGGAAGAADDEPADGARGERKARGEVVHDRGVVRERSHWSQPATEYIAAVPLDGDATIEFSQSGADMVAGVSVRRVPIRHARDVQTVLGLLRQQETFNALFVSCFGAPRRAAPARAPLLRQPVEVVVADAPALLQLTLFDAAADDMLSVAVHVLVGGDVAVRLQLSTRRPHVCSDAKATALLKLCRSIPLTLRSIVELSRGAAPAPVPAVPPAPVAAPGVEPAPMIT